MAIVKLVLSGCSVNNPKVVTILIQLLIIPDYISCNMLYIFSSHICAPCSVSHPDKMFTKGLFINKYLFMKFYGGVSLWFG